MNTNLCPTNMSLYVHTINSYRRSNLCICSPLVIIKKRVIIDEVFNLKKQITITLQTRYFIHLRTFMNILTVCILNVTGMKFRIT